MEKCIGCGLQESACTCDIYIPDESWSNPDSNPLQDILDYVSDGKTAFMLKPLSDTEAVFLHTTKLRCERCEYQAQSVTDLADHYYKEHPSPKEVKEREAVILEQLGARVQMNADALYGCQQ